VNIVKKYRLFIIISILIIIPQISFGIPMKLNYQGFLKNKNKDIISSSVSIQFSLYNSEDSNDAVWTELHENVLVNEGMFNVVLGEITALNGSLFDDDLYLGIKIDNDPEMKPRHKFHSAAFAIKASAAQSLSGNLNGNQILDRTIDITKLNFVDEKGNYQIQGNIIIEDGISIKELRPDFSPEIMQSGCSNGSGTYEIHSDLIDNSFLVYCDMFTDGGGWTLIALNDQTTTFTNFNKNWNEYKNGFGNLSSKQLGWLGNDKIHALTNEGNKTLMVKTDSNVHKYNSFKIDNESNKYKMTFDDSPLSNDGNQFTNHNNKFFSTYDRDNDSGGSNCASQYKSGWWFNACYYMTIAGNSNNKVYWQNSSGTLYYVDWIEMWIK